MVTATQILAHLVGDYLLQSHWMANNKSKSSYAALTHVVMYSLPFVILTNPSVWALLVIAGTHFIIDRWRLARQVTWFKNWLLAPKGKGPTWEECKSTGFPSDTPAFLAVWLLIITDNTLHLLINALALKYL